MSEVKVPVVSVEIFHSPGFADDNFIKTWTKITGGTSSFIQDGEYAYLNKGDQLHCEIEKTFADLDSNVYTRLQIRTPTTNATWQVLLWDGAAWAVVLEQSTTGIFEAVLPAAKIYSKIRLKTFGITDFDYVFITKSAMLTPTVDLAETAEITLPLLEMGVSGAKFSLPNNNAEYTGKITEFDRIIIWLYRAGEAAKKIFGGIISDYVYRGRQQNYWIDVDCLGLGQQLHSPVSLVRKVYIAKNGRIIIKESIDAECPLLTDKFVDVDSEIASTHDLELDEVLPYNVINEICRKATTTAGVVGFDGYVDSAGNLHIFRRNKYTSPLDLTANKILQYDRRIDAHRIKNKIVVYGGFGGTFPVGIDDWCESTAGWTVLEGEWVAVTDRKVGAYALRTVNNPNYKAQVRRMFSSIVCDTKFKGGFGKLNFWGKDNTLHQVIIRLLAPDASNYFEHAHFLGDDWTYYSWSLGRTAEAEGFWTKVGSPDWLNVCGIEIFTSDTILSSGGWFDALHFAEGRFRGAEENSASISKYGTRKAETQVDDELQSNDECEKKAKSLIDFLKEKIESLTVTTDGDNRFTPGDRQRVVIPNDNLDAFYRILEVRHVLSDVTWDTILKLSNEPKIIDYIFASTAAPRYAGATVIVPRDFSTIQEGINAVVIQ